MGPGKVGWRQMRLFEDTSVTIFEDISVTIFEDTSVTIFEDSSVTIFEDTSVTIFEDTSVTLFENTSVESDIVFEYTFSSHCGINLNINICIAYIVFKNTFV